MGNKCYNCQNEQTPNCDRCAITYGNDSLEDLFVPKKPRYVHKSKEKMIGEVNKLPLENKIIEKRMANKNDEYSKLRLIRFDVSIININNLQVMFKFNDESIMDFRVSINLAKGLVNTVFKRMKETEGILEPPNEIEGD